MRFFITLILLFAFIVLYGQSWNKKKCAVVLTYDDAVDVHLDNALPVLDSLKLKGTFYLIGSSPVTSKRLNEWRAAATNGHELGNHSLCHPCDGSRPGRSFVTPDTDLSLYTVSRAVKEIRLNNTLLRSIDGKDSRTFAYPCVDLQIGNVFFYDELKNDFVGARGGGDKMDRLDNLKLDNIGSYMINGKNAGYMIDLVNQAIKTNSLLVFMFHGVGGGHNLNVDLKEHSKLLHYLKQHENEIWIAPMVDVAAFVKSARENPAGK